MNAYYEQLYGVWNAAQQTTEINARGLANCMGACVNYFGAARERQVPDPRERELEERNLSNLAAWRKKYNEHRLNADFKNHNQFAKGRKSYACCVGGVK